MGKVVVGATISLDGFINDPSGDLTPLYPDLDAMRRSEILRESIRATGAAVMGRRTYDMGDPDGFGEYEYQVPIFVLTHRIPKTPLPGQNDKLKFVFVTDGIESAIRQAKAAARDKDVTVVGGASIAQQILRAGLADEVDLLIAPLLLGGGLRFFAEDPPQLRLETIAAKPEAWSMPGVTHLRMRVVR